MVQFIDIRGQGANSRLYLTQMLKDYSTKFNIILIIH